MDSGLHGGAIGDCATDSFSVSGSHFGSPAICGTNAGQHSKLHFIFKILNIVFPWIEFSLKVFPIQFQFMLMLTRIVWDQISYLELVQTLENIP